MADVELDLSPAPGAAPVTRRWAAQASMEWRLLMTNGEQLLLTLVIPIVVLVAVVKLGLAPVASAVPGVLALAILSSAFAATAIATGFERRSRVLKFLSATPLSRTGLLVGKVAATLAVIAGQWLLVGLAGLALGWRPAGANWLAASVFLLLGTISLGAWGFALAGLLRAEATLAVANAVFLLLMFAGGTVIPAGFGPGWLQDLISLLPSAALGSGLRGALDPSAASAGYPWAQVAILSAWALAGVVTAARTFRWQ